MKYNRLGNTGLFVSELGFGAMTFGENEGYPMLGGLGQQEANTLVARAFEAGVNLFDTADNYAVGASERFFWRGPSKPGCFARKLLDRHQGLFADGTRPE